MSSPTHARLPIKATIVTLDPVRFGSLCLEQTESKPIELRHQRLYLRLLEQYHMLGYCS